MSKRLVSVPSTCSVGPLTLRGQLRRDFHRLRANLRSGTGGLPLVLEFGRTWAVEGSLFKVAGFWRFLSALAKFVPFFDILPVLAPTPSALKKEIEQ